MPEMSRPSAEKSERLVLLGFTVILTRARVCVCVCVCPVCVCVCVLCVCMGKAKQSRYRPGVAQSVPGS